MTQVQRHHWLNTFVGILDAAFNLTDVEQASVISILREMLQSLCIPERGEPAELPAPVALEVTSSFFSVVLAGTRDSQVARPVRAAERTDMVVSLEAWREALVSMLMVAYPEMGPAERLLMHKIFSDVLAGIGVPQRAAEFLPADVVRAYHSLPESRTW